MSFILLSPLISLLSPSRSGYKLQQLVSLPTFTKIGNESFQCLYYIGKAHYEQVCHFLSQCDEPLCPLDEFQVVGGEAAPTAMWLVKQMKSSLFI